MAAGLVCDQKSPCNQWRRMVGQRVLRATVHLWPEGPWDSPRARPVEWPKGLCIAIARRQADGFMGPMFPQLAAVKITMPNLSH